MTRTRYHLRAVALSTAALTVLAGCSSSSKPAAPVRHVLTGTVTVPDTTAALRDKCSQGEDYPDITVGGQVTVYNQAGTVVGVGQITTGHPIDNQVVLGGSCRWTFTVPGVPAASTYGVEVTHRGQVHYTAAQMAASRWHVDLTLG